jgi:hypothetical protein
MPSHVIVDGSNLATEGRTMPSLKQLNEAIASYRADHPEALMTIVVDATFGHRIDPKEVAEFEKAIETNSFVAPPAGAVGRGDGFILSIAQKANASILSNDSYQEFHGEYAWLFDDGRLIGGKPVPHVGWVWVNRVPVRGPVSRRSVKEQKIVEKSPGRRRGSKVSDLPSISADAPMPVPTAAPPGAVMPGQKLAKPNQRKSDQTKAEQNRADQSKAEQTRADQDRGEQGKQDASKTTNDLLAFLSFVEHFPVGTGVTGVVETYSSHGAYVLIGDVHGYVPLRLMADPAPRSAREVMDLGETVTLIVSSFGPARRSIDLAVPSMAPVIAPPPPSKARGGKAAQKAAKAAAELAEFVTAEALAADAVANQLSDPGTTIDAPSTKRPRASKKSAKAAQTSKATNAAPESAAPRKSARRPAAVPPPPAGPAVAPAKATARRAAKAAPRAPQPAAPPSAAPAKQPSRRRSPKKAADPS